MCICSFKFFVPFDGFFNAQFRQNLTHTARRIIDRAASLDDVKNDPFAQRVVNTLFMISNLIDSKQITFPANLDNLSMLLMEDPDTNKLELQRNIQKVIEKLQKDLIKFKIKKTIKKTTKANKS